MADVGRNDPCPCGSGQKYKRCHWDKELPGARKDAAGGGSGIPGDEGVSTMRIVLLLIVVIVAISGLLYVVVSPRLGYSAGGIAGLIVLMWAAWRSPPPVRDETSDSSAINFGTTNKSK